MLEHFTEAAEQSRPSSHGAGRGPTVGLGRQTATSTVGALPMLLLLLLSHSSPPPVAAAAAAELLLL